MRDPKRIRKFCNRLAELWETECPDWRFGQLVGNVFSAISSGTDSFYIEDEEMLTLFNRYFLREEDGK